MDYTKYDTAIVQDDRSLLGRAGLDEATVSDAKGKLKAVANIAKAALGAAANVGKAVVPGIGHSASLAVGAVSAAQGTKALASTGKHLKVLYEIQSDLADGRVECQCGNCLEVVGYAISQKTLKATRVADGLTALAIDTFVPVPMHLGAINAAERATHTMAKKASGELGVERTRQAERLHQGARGMRIRADDGTSSFVGYCVVARAIIDELTSGHWRRWVLSEHGAQGFRRKLASR